MLPCFGLLSSFSHNGFVFGKTVSPDLVFCHRRGCTSLPLACLLQTPGPSLPPSFHTCFVSHLAAAVGAYTRLWHCSMMGCSRRRPMQWQPYWLPPLASAVKTCMPPASTLQACPFAPPAWHHPQGPTRVTSSDASMSVHPVRALNQ